MIIVIANATTTPDLLTLTRRFAGRVERHKECWLWTGATNSKGYPVFRVGREIWLAHRFSHELFIGPITPGEQVHHKCCNPLCVAPEHLQAVTPEVNRKLQALGVGVHDEIPF